jgi:hypothetical protein
VQGPRPIIGNGGERPNSPVPRPTTPNEQRVIREFARLGGGNYTGINNLNRTGVQSPAFNVGPPPIVVGTGGWNDFLIREEVARRVQQQLRRGYFHYDRGWTDSFFCYPYYAFIPVYNQTVFSPWYSYAHMPGYIYVRRSTFLDNILPIVITGLIYNWNRPHHVAYSPIRTTGARYNELDYALGDLVDAFEYRDPQALARVIGDNRVNVFFENRYAYTLSGNDFYDLMLDLVVQTETVGYQFERIYRDRDRVTAIAVHQYLDPWGRLLTQYHTYVLRQNRRGVTITDFAISDSWNPGQSRRLGR